MHNDLYLVTGAAGFVGRFMVDLLLEQGVQVRAMVRKIETCGDLKDLPVELVEADLRDEESLKKAVAGVKGVYHIASLFRAAGLPEEVFEDINATGTTRLFDAAIEAGVERIIHCSTVGVLGHVEEPPGTEQSPVAPGDMYQRTKLAGEQIALSYFEAEKIRGVVIRPAMIYGPGDERTLKLFKMIAKGLFFYVGKGLASVHWVDVRDLVNAFKLAMDKSDLNNEIYIIGGESHHSLKEMANLVADKLEVRRPWIHLPVKPMQWLGSLCEAVCTPFGIQPPIFRRRVDFYTKSRHFDCNKAHRELGYVPAQSFEQELDDIIQGYRAKQLI